MGHRFILVLLLGVAAITAPAQEENTSQNARKAVRQVAPVYPDLARRLQISGVVKLRVTIAPSGSVKSIEPVGGNPLLLKAAQEAVTNWKYSPAGSETHELIELRFSGR
jgi:TonB family protein